MDYTKVVLAICLWREARGEGEVGMRAVYHVILNRSKDERWPSDPLKVALQPYQFSCFNRTEPQAWPSPGGQDWDLFLLACSIVENPKPEDPTGGANHYFAPKSVKQPPPWSVGQLPSATIGKHEFFRL